MTLKDLIERNDTVAGRIFDLSIQGLIVLSLISFCIETLPDISVTTQRVLHYLETITVAIFSIEYLLRLAVAETRLRYVFSFYGLIDLAAVLPFYLSTGIDLRSIRVFRLLRVFRAFKLFRFSRAITRFANAFGEIKAELALFFTATMFLLFVAGVGIYYFENPAQPEQFRSVFHSLWWAVATLTTVGYGDVYPITVGGKVFTFVILMIGLGIIAVPAGLLASALTREMAKEEE